jgi:hypothetical protein
MVPAICFFPIETGDFPSHHYWRVCRVHFIFRYGWHIWSLQVTRFQNFWVQVALVIGWRWILAMEDEFGARPGRGRKCWSCHILDLLGYSILTEILTYAFHFFPISKRWAFDILIFAYIRTLHELVSLSYCWYKHGSNSFDSVPQLRCKYIHPFSQMIDPHFVGRRGSSRCRFHKFHKDSEEGGVILGKGISSHCYGPMFDRSAATTLTNDLGLQSCHHQILDCPM